MDQDEPDDHGRTATDVLRDNAGRPLFWIAILGTVIAGLALTNALGVSEMWALPATAIVARLFIR